MYSLTELMSALIGKGFQRASEAAPDPRSAGLATSIRLSPEARSWYTVQANTFGEMSMAAFVALVLEGVMQASKGAGSTEFDRVKRTLDLSLDRFLHLMRVHKIDPQMMSSLYQDAGFTMSALSDRDKLRDLLVGPLLDQVSQDFHVATGWIKGNRDSSFEDVIIWYKDPQGAVRKLIHMLKADERPHLYFVRRHNADFETAYAKGDNAPTEPVGVIVRTEHIAGNQHYSTYKCWDFERWNYFKCRCYLKALIYWLVQQNSHASYFGKVYWEGISVDATLISRLMRGELMAAEVLEAARGDRGIWDPEDYMDPARSKELDEIDNVIKNYYEPDRMKELFAELTKHN